MASTRALHTSTVLTNGKVIVIGGYQYADLRSAELYDPSTHDLVIHYPHYQMENN
jgi:hypothetical protein